MGKFSEKLFAPEIDRMREVVQAIDWYKDIKPTKQLRLVGTGALQAAFGGNILNASDRVKERLLEMFEQLLLEDAVRLGGEGDEVENWDEERQTPLDKVVIHHTNRESGLTRERLNAMHLLRLYVPRYTSKKDPLLDSKGQPQALSSGHYDETGKQVFYGYHWLVRQDGETERLLDDSAIGWHAGNWDVNRSSVAVCIDGDLTSARPNVAVMEGIVDLLRNNYADIDMSTESLLGHNEVYSSTVCPGDQFQNDWKLQLLRELE